MSKKVIPIGKTFEKDVEVMPSEDYEEPELKVAIVDDRHKYCPHEHIQIYEHHRKITCKDCGASIDPFNWILMIGQKERNLLSERRILSWDIKHKKEDIEDLKKQISKLKKEIKNII